MEDLELYNKKGLFEIISRIAFIITIVIIFAIVSIPFFFALCPVAQHSMTPTILDGQTVLLNKVDDTLTNGEIVVFNKNGTNFIKRIIAKPGDIIEFKPNEEKNIEYSMVTGKIISCEEVFVYINGNKLDESYIKEPMKYPFPGTVVYYNNLSQVKYETLGLNNPLTISENQYFCMGDNRNGSLDCRSTRDNSNLPFGLVDKKEIIGSLAYIVPMGSFIEGYFKLVYGQNSLFDLFK